MPVDLHAVADLTAPPAAAFAALEDLATYPRWLSIVAAARPIDAHPADPGPAWLVELRGKVGPFSKTKRVRMVRTGHDPAAGTVRFERHEHDGRSHNVWILTGSATERAGDGSHVDVLLHYGGGAIFPGADLLLRQETRRAGERLDAYVRTLG